MYVKEQRFAIEIKTSIYNISLIYVWLVTWELFCKVLSLQSLKRTGIDFE